MKRSKIQELQVLVGDMYWEYDRVSSSGQKTLDKIAKLLGVPTEEEISNMSEETALQYEELVGN